MLSHFSHGLPTPVFLGFPCGPAGKKNPRAMQLNLGSIPELGRLLWKRERLPTPVFWPREFHGLYSPWGHKESDTTELLSILLSSHFSHVRLCCDPLDCSLPGSSFHGILQARILEWVAMPSFRVFGLKDETCLSYALLLSCTDHLGNP